MLFVKTGTMPLGSAGLRGARGDKGHDTIILLDETLSLHEQSDLLAVLLGQRPTVPLPRAS